MNAHPNRLKEAAQRQRELREVDRIRQSTARPTEARPDAYRDLVRHGWQDWHGGNEL